MRVAPRENASKTPESTVEERADGALSVLMFCGGYDDPEPGLDFFLAPVAFPMEVANPNAGDDGEPDTLLLRDSAELVAWARDRFFSHDLWEMEVPEAAILTEEDRRCAP
jgi:hypothetical protein